jgi:ATP/maltotriose-dependent transcriptional regulator MalT
MSIATWCGLLAEMHLAAAEPEQAAEALDRSIQALETFGQTFAEGLILLIRARLLQAQGRPVAEVQAAAETARDLSTAREAHLFAHRTEAFLATLTDRKQVLLVIGRSDEAGAKSVRNLPGVHILTPGQLNTYDVLRSDDVVFSVEALNAYISANTGTPEEVSA